MGQQWPVSAAAGQRLPTAADKRHLCQLELSAEKEKISLVRRDGWKLPGKPWAPGGTSHPDGRSEHGDHVSGPPSAEGSAPPQGSPSLRTSTGLPHQLPKAGAVRSVQPCFLT